MQLFRFIHKVINDNDDEIVKESELTLASILLIALFIMFVRYGIEFNNVISVMCLIATILAFVVYVSHLAVYIVDQRKCRRQEK